MSNVSFKTLQQRYAMSMLEKISTDFITSPTESHVSV
jgi:hypothetical protein